MRMWHVQTALISYFNLFLKYHVLSKRLDCNSNYTYIEQNVDYIGREISV